MVMVAWENAEEMGRSMIMKDLIDNTKDFELCPKTHGKSSEQRRNRDMLIFVFQKNHSLYYVEKRQEIRLDTEGMLVQVRYDGQLDQVGARMLWLLNNILNWATYCTSNVEPLKILSREVTLSYIHF